MKMTSAILALALWLGTSVPLSAQDQPPGPPPGVRATEPTSYRATLLVAGQTLSESAKTYSSNPGDSSGVAAVAGANVNLTIESGEFQADLLTFRRREVGQFSENFSLAHRLKLTRPAEMSFRISTPRRTVTESGPSLLLCLDRKSKI